MTLGFASLALTVITVLPFADEDRFVHHDAQEQYSSRTFYSCGKCVCSTTELHVCEFSSAREQSGHYIALQHLYSKAHACQTGAQIHPQ